jgi:hypothetical protein
MTRDEAIQILVDYATGKAWHRYCGASALCPDGIDHDTRDPDCDVCQAIGVMEQPDPVEPGTFTATIRMPPEFTRRLGDACFGGLCPVCGGIADDGEPCECPCHDNMLEDRDP